MTATLDILGTPKTAEAGLRVSVVQDQLARALGIVGRATGNRNTMPILGYVHASTDGERLRLTATNLETSITAWVPARVLSDGVACLQGSVIRETVGALPAGRDVSIEAKATALRVECERVGVNLKGKLHPACTATDLVLTITEMLRKAKVVGKFVEFFGEGTASLSVTDRATIGNMAPEYGATMGFFPVDDKTVDYFRGTGRTEEELAAFENYFKAQQLFGIPREGEIGRAHV